MKQLRVNPNLFLVLLLGLWTIFNLCQAAFTELAGDEAYYWVLSKDLGWGYYDHPPFFGWIMALGTSLFGDTELGVRCISVLLQPIYLYLFWTLVRTSRSTTRTALIYFLTAFSIPLLQLYGFIATPDAPLMFSTALVLWAYKRFLACENQAFTPGAIASMVLMGVSVALLGYAKYHGALLIALIVFSNFDLLRQPRFYGAVIVGVVCFLPHLLWQYNHHWASFAYHLSGRTSGFDLENLWLYFVNLIAVFHPFLLPIFLILILKNGRKDRVNINKKQVDKFALALKFITWGFLLFFLIQVWKVHVQPQWLIPITFPMLYFITRGAESRPGLWKYVRTVGVVSVILFVAFKTFVMAYTGDKIPAEIFQNRKLYSSFADSLHGRPFIANGSYVFASKLRFYGQNAAYARPNIYTRSSHYEFMDMDSHLYMKPVAIEISDSVYRAMTTAQKDTTFLHAKVQRFDLYYDTIANYIPSRNVEVEWTLPDKVLSNHELVLDIIIKNPYPFNIPLGVGRDKFELFLQLRRSRFESVEIAIPLKSQYVPAQGSVEESTRTFIPKMSTDQYTAGFTLIRYPYGAWFNGKRVKMRVVNPSDNVQ